MQGSVGQQRTPFPTTRKPLTHDFVSCVPMIAVSRPIPAESQWLNTFHLGVRELGSQAVHSRPSGEWHDVRDDSCRWMVSRRAGEIDMCVQKYHLSTLRDYDIKPFWYIAN